MKTINLISRILFGLLLLIFGLNNFLHFMPYPEMSQEAGIFLGALASTGYIFPIVGAVEVIVGLLLISNKFTSLALVLIFPVILNALLFHLFLDLPGIAASLIAFVLNVFLFIVNKDNYASMLSLTQSEK